MDIHTDFPDRLVPGKEIYLTEIHAPHVIENVRGHADGLLIKFRGADTPEAVARLRNKWVYVRAADVPPLANGQHYKYEIIGVHVTDDTGRALGRVSEILETGANDVYIVQNGAGKEILLPAIPQVVLDLDLSQRSMRVHLLDGL